MSEYRFREIEKKWQKYWEENKTFRAENTTGNPKFYVLDMFPYPSGAGLHVGHPLGYIGSDIVARYKRHQGFNVLHPMGFDSFGLPAEQYAVQTGQHPAVTTEENINRYKEQLKNIGFSFDWSREVRTSDKSYYKFTQQIFLWLFKSWYNNKTDKAEPIETLISELEKNGNCEIDAACDEQTTIFSADEWNKMTEKERGEVLLNYRLAYLAESTVNWCPELGTVLANEEVKDGLSERGGHPVVRKKMKQWMLRITAYADRLLQGLEKIDWPEPIKEMQRNWIGKSRGGELEFQVEGTDFSMRIFTTRPDTVFGTTYMVIAPEHELLSELLSEEQKESVLNYVEEAKNRSERDRMSDVKTVTGVFTGKYAINPFNNEKIPIWTADYVLAGYGTGAIMAVPAHDDRDYAFAKQFDLPIKPVIDGGDIEEGAYSSWDANVINSDFITGMKVPDAIDAVIKKAESLGIGKGKTNYRLRDAVFGRQRYWGEPVPVYFKDEIPYPVDESDLPLILPEIDEYKPTPEGDPPLGRAKNWKYKEQYEYELSTMPGWAGSSWYFFRYMDTANENEFVGQSAQQFWENVDLYIGGAEHAAGHLLYARFWTKFLYDLGKVNVREPFKKLVNQGMIQGRSNIVYRIKGTDTFVSYNLRKEYDVTPLHTDVNIVENDVLDIEAFKKWRPDLKNAEFILEDGKYICGFEVEKMSKRLHNVVNPDDIVERYGADTLRMYEMFLGPIEQSKPWNTNGIDGVFKFLRKFWRLFFDETDNFLVSDDEPSEKELKILHKTLKKIGDDIEKLSLNTSVSAFMICVNELTTLKCNKRAVLEPLTVALSPFAPHITEEIGELLGHKNGISEIPWPAVNEKYLTEESFEYPIAINGKTKLKMNFSAEATPSDIEKEVLASEELQSKLGGKSPKKIIVVPKRMVNVVV